MMMMLRSVKIVSNSHNNLMRKVAYYSVQTMTVKEYSKILKSHELRNNYQIVDVREPDELQAVNVQDKNILNLPISESWKWGTDIARHKILNPDKPVVCVCRSGGRSMTFATFLRTVGFEEVYNVDGGMEEYADVIDPTVRRKTTG